MAALSNTTTPDDQLIKIATALVAQGSSKVAVAKQINTRGFRAYKLKDYDRAGSAFEAAHSVNPIYELPVLNRAGIAGLKGDAATCVAWLKKLQVIGTPKARKLLTDQVATDHDFDKVRDADVFKEFMAGVQ